MARRFIISSAAVDKSVARDADVAKKMSCTFCQELVYSMLQF